MADLKPCPFCGAAAAMRSTGGWHAAGCLTLKCPAQIYALVHRSEHEAAYAWNTRRPAGVPAASAPAEAHPIWPIAKLMIQDGRCVHASLYAPGLPDGEHDVYPLPVDADAVPVGVAPTDGGQG